MSDVIRYGFCLILLAAMVQDIARLRISNLFSLALMLLFALWLWDQGVPATIWQNGLLFAIVLGLGMFLFAIGWLGGGDVKLLAAAALWFDLKGGLVLIGLVSLSGGLVGLALILMRHRLPLGLRDRLGWPALNPKGPIPYGIAIAIGAIWTLLAHGPNPSGLHDLSSFALPDDTSHR